MATILLLALIPVGYGQSFMTVQKKSRPSDIEGMTLMFVPDPGPGNTGVVPAHAVERPGANPDFQVIPVAAQPPGNPPGKEQEDKELLIRTDLPGNQRLFIRESEAQFWNRYRNELGKEGRALFIPEPVVISTEQYRPRSFVPITKHVEPSYVCHRRLLFEQPNFERTGWDLGIITPAVNLAVFYYDFAMLPYHFWSDPHDRGECNAGKCLPGDPAPLLLYRERYSTMGLIGQAATVTGLLFLFP